MRNNLAIKLPLLVVAIVLAGAGCNEIGNQVGDAIVQPVAVPVAALNKAKQVTAEAQAVMNEQAESIANEVTVAMVLTEGATAPADATVGEMFGCSDKVASTKAARASDTSDTLKDVLASLFAVRDSNFRNLYNALSQSTLKVDKIQSTDGVTTEVWLKGQIQSGGVCDDPRIKKQVEATIARLKPHFKIFLNGTEDNWRCIGDMSGQCGQKSATPPSATPKP